MSHGVESNQCALVFYDDARARTFEPFALSRPFSEMRVGALLVRERWEYALNGRAAGFLASTHLAHFDEIGNCRARAGDIPSGSVLVNTRAAISLKGLRQLHSNAQSRCRAWYIGNRVAAIELSESVASSVFDAGLPELEQFLPADVMRIDVDGQWIEEIWNVTSSLNSMLPHDIEFLAGARQTLQVVELGTNQTVIGGGAVYLEPNAIVEPFVVFDTTNGPVYLSAGSTVQAFTRVVGPCYVGRDSVLLGERISGSSIGDMCRVHGELSATVFLGCANKGHDGFVGHSIVGRWVNMGAGTITSNLKNTYGTVALWTPAGVRDTGMQFLGTLFGDHAKTGIGMKLTTGCVLGMGANVFDRMPPKAVEPFAWGAGAPYDSYDVAKFIDTAARMMSRRNVALTESARQAIRDAHAARWHTR